MAIACAGYRVTARTGHHKVTVDAVTLAVGAAVSAYADYFETCRRKRNVIDYTRSHVATDSEADEIVNQARAFYDVAEAWIVLKLPSLQR
jgi:hypothetical protein